MSSVFWPIADKMNQDDLHKAVDVEQKELDRQQRQELAEKNSGEATTTFDGVVVVNNRDEARKVMNWSEVEGSQQEDQDLEDHSQFFMNDDDEE